MKSTVKLSTLFICLISTLAIVSIGFNYFQMKMINFLAEPYEDFVRLKNEMQVVNNELNETLYNLKNQKENYFDPLLFQLEVNSEIEEKDNSLVLLDETYGGGE